jgi:NADH-quinone oxidoreductase subunit C
MTIAQSAAEKLKRQFPDETFEVVTFRDETTIFVSRDKVVEICRFLRDDADLKFNFLSDLTAVDLLNRHRVEPDLPLDHPRFEVVYHLYSLEHYTFLRLKVRVSEDDAHVPTVTGVWSTANWHEREVFDMMGISFDGHPDPRRIITAEQVYDEVEERWKPMDGHPLRKDFDLDYQPVDFTVRIMDRHLAKE